MSWLLVLVVVASTVVGDLLQTLEMKRQLETRKLVERAKGLLQEALGWSEEQAYLHIRRLSRQQRTPMREIARQ